MLPRRDERELRIHEPAYLTKQHMDLDPSVWGHGFGSFCVGHILVYKDYRVQRETMVMWNFREDAGCQVPYKAMRGVPQIDLSLTMVISI